MYVYMYMYYIYIYVYIRKKKNVVLIFGKVHLCENLSTVTTRTLQTLDILAF